MTFFEILKGIKKSCPWIWTVIECGNGIAVKLLYRKTIIKKAKEAINVNDGYSYRILNEKDAQSLVDFIRRQPIGFDKYFKPHDFDFNTFKRALGNGTYLFVGAFDEGKMVGYCFLRFVVTKSAYRGKIVDATYQGKGIAKQMSIILTKIALNSGFRLFATISKDNVASMNSSMAVNEISVIKELADNYVYIEYLGLK